MISTLVVGVLFAGIILWAALKSKKDLQSGKCAGCNIENCSSRQNKKIPPE